MSTLLVTGGAGYIGSHTVRMLTEKGHHCVVVDNLSGGHREAVGKTDFEQIDLRSYAALDAVFNKYEIDAVVHFAAVSLVGESVENPQKYYENNVGGTMNLLNAMLKHDVKKIVFSSSCSVYGVPQAPLLDETHPCHPINPYGTTKRVIERMLSDYHDAYDLKYITLRYFNAAGASKDASIGESHTPETHLIPLILQTIQGKRENITVYGKDYPTPDGTCIRDYVHVDDLASAHCKALKHSDEFNGVLNLGTGQGYSVREIITACEKITGKKCPVVFGEKRAGDPSVLCADATKAKKVLGWVPKYTSPSKMIETAWRWEENRKF